MIKTDASDIFFMKKDCAIVQRWKGVIRHQAFRDTINYTIDMIIKNDARFIISDTRKSKRVADKELNWLIESIDQRLVDIGLKALVFIIASEGLAKKGIQYYKNNSILDIYICRNMKEAERIIDDLRRQ